jgi:SET domain-containing protein
MDNWNIATSKIHGVGILASKTLPPNSFVDIAIDSQNEITKFGSKLNHSWNPTSRLIYSRGTKTYDIYTIKQINKGDEITVDYTFTPDFIVKPDVRWK